MKMIVCNATQIKMSLTDIAQMVSVLMDSVSVLIIGDSKHKKNITITNCCILPLSIKMSKQVFNFFGADVNE